MLFKGKHGLYVKAYKIIKIIMCCISLPSPDAESELGNAEAWIMSLRLICGEDRKLDFAPCVSHCLWDPSRAGRLGGSV